MGGEGSGRRRTVDYLMARESFVAMVDGELLSVSKGDLVHPEHPVAKGRAHLFDPARNHVRYDIEQATSAPGERRGDAA